MNATTPLANPILDSSSPRDWAEDGGFENGRYLCRCVTCKLTFTGYKRRVTCRVCAKRGESEANRRQQMLRTAGFSESEWVLVTPREQARDHARYANLLLELMVERNLRRDLAAALTRVTTAAAKSPPVAGLHYALKDGREIVAESVALDAEIAAREAKRDGRATV